MASGAHQRYAQARKVVGVDLHHRISGLKTLVVGAGGIGCELLKNLVCTGFGDITIVDLDTIDTSNLNRQFLFQKRHVKRAKSLVARESALAFNPRVSIEALHANIKDPQFDTAFFARFALVMNALDNLDARRHVNKMCVAAGVPLLESGTAGYRGQVQPIRQGVAECYDCQPKPVAKSYPVCTIRSTPSTPVHCIVWAKSYLFPQLFGTEEVDDSELDEAVRKGESVKEIENLKREAKDMQHLRSQLAAPEASRAVFHKVFHDDIKRLLNMEDMWKHRRKPIPLDHASLSSEPLSFAPTADGHRAQLRDQRVFSVHDSFVLFDSSLKALVARTQQSPGVLDWDKDDDDALDFATAAANLRAAVFGIPLKTRFEVKEMAGNIIPAIATTNSAVSALLVLQALEIIRAEATKWTRVSRPWFGKTAERIVTCGQVEPPNRNCETCQAVYVHLKVAPACTLAQVVETVSHHLPHVGTDPTIQDAERLLFDPDFDDNLDKSIDELGLRPGTMLTITDEAERFVPLVLVMDRPAVGGQHLINGVFPPSLPNRSMDILPSRKRAGSEVSQVGPSGKRIRLEHLDDAIIVLEGDSNIAIIED